MSKKKSPTLLTAEDYMSDLAVKIDNAKQRVNMVATTFRADDTHTEAVIAAVERAAAERGVPASVCADSFTYLEPKEFILRSPRRQPSRAVHAMKLERRLKKAGVAFRWLGQKANMLMTGRTHSKWSIVDDIVYACGGVNMDHESLANVDYMFRFDNKVLADKLSNEQYLIARADKRGGSIRNSMFGLDEHSTVLVDQGLPTNSLIYRRACDLAEQAENIVLVSQYCPTGKLNRILKRKNAKLYFNNWRTASPINKLLIKLGTLTSRQQTLYQHPQYLHAKFIIFTMPDGSKIALSGSHNFMRGSGIMGTREIALETSDPAIIKQLEAFRKKYVE